MIFSAWDHTKKKTGFLKTLCLLGMPAGKAPPSLALVPYDDDADEEGENEMGLGNVSPLGDDEDNDDGGEGAPASPSASVIDPTLDVLMGMEDFDDGEGDGDDPIVDLVDSPESPQELATDGLPLFDPNDPIEDFPAGESQPLGSHVDKASECEKGDDHSGEFRPVARPLNNVNPKSLPLYPVEDGLRNEFGDCPLECIMDHRPASSASGASSSSSGSTPSDRASMLKELWGKMADMHQSLEAM